MSDDELIFTISTIIDQRFDAMIQRLAIRDQAIEQRFDAMIQRFDAMEQKFDNALTTIRKDIGDIKDSVKKIELYQENMIIPRLDALAETLTTYKR